MLEHALQVAYQSEQQSESEESVLACLLHDVGNSPQARSRHLKTTGLEAALMVAEDDGSIGYENHSTIGAAFVRTMGFSDVVANAVGMHVAAKRALVTLDEEYFSRLSKASVETLKQQGGPMSSDEVSDFLAIGPAAELAMRLRKYDELGKEPDLVVEGGLSRFRGLIYDHLRAMSQAVIDPS